MNLFQLLTDKTIKLGWDHPLVFHSPKSELILWDGDLDEALYQLGLEIVEDGTTMDDGEIMELRNFTTIGHLQPVQLIIIGDDQWINFMGATYLEASHSIA